MQYKSIIVEDEPLSMERVREYIHREPSLWLAGEFETGIQAKHFLQNNSTDIIFLDINIGALSGLQLLELIKPDAEVILTTASHEHAIKGFDLAVTDYLLKPYTFERFMIAINKAQANLDTAKTLSVRPFLFIKTEHRLEKVFIDEILYIEGMRDYRRVHTVNKKIMTLKTFGELEQELDPELVCRIHKSYMISRSMISSIGTDSVMIGTESFPISEKYRKAFFELVFKNNHYPKN